MDISIFLAKVMGLYFIIISLSLLIIKNRMKSIISGIFRNSSLQFVMGFIILIIGLLLVISHNIWTNSWQVLITIIAWLTLIKGILNLSFPKIIEKMTTPFLKSKILPYVSIMLNFLVGVFLCYHAFCIL